MHIGLPYASGMSTATHDTTSDIVKELMDILKLTQTDIAKIAGTTQSSVCRWLDGTNQPSKPSWDKLMQFASDNPATAHLVHRYIFGLLRDDMSKFGHLVSAAFGRKTG
jgi:DNA-binding transcriptional regulator YiaG